MNTALLARLSLAALPLVVAACGGAGSSLSEPPPPSGEAKAIAAAQTVRDNPACTALTPFYWEIGDATTKLAQGTGGSSASGAPADTDMLLIASASKWLYSAFIVEWRRSAGASISLTQDVPYLNFTSGYMNFGIPSCPGTGDTIDQCLSAINRIGGSNGLPKGAFSSEYVGKFYYDSGHMQKHASNVGFGSYTGLTLGNVVSQHLGINVKYADAHPAGSGQTSAAEYARFLRKVLSGSLGITALLGTNAVCTWHNAYSQACSAFSSPTDSTNLHWHYSLGHWVEDDEPGNLAYSSAGAFGFYPWVSADLQLYGIIAREQVASGDQQGFQSAKCGRLVRLAYRTGVAQ